MYALDEFVIKNCENTLNRCRWLADVFGIATLSQLAV